jgi:hypothetical protein
MATMRHRQLPQIHVGMRPWIPGWVFRVLAVLAPVATLQTLATVSEPNSAVHTALSWATALIAVWIVWRPGPPAAVALIAVCAMLIWLLPGPQPELVALWLAPALFLCLRLGAWAQMVGWSSRVELGSLSAAARRDGAIVVVNVCVGVLVLAVTGPSWVLLVAGAPALVATALLAVRAPTAPS